MLNIIIFGAPGSGKGTQSKLLKDKYNLLHLSTGELLRKEIENGTQIGEIANKYISEGNLVPDDMMVEILAKTIEENEEKDGYNGVILDGFPRTIAQAKALEELIRQKNHQTPILLDLAVQEEELVERILNRGKTSGRSDDNLETVKARLEVYKNETQPLSDYYKKQKKYTIIDGTGTIDEIFARICKVIDILNPKNKV